MQNISSAIAKNLYSTGMIQALQNNGLEKK